MKRRGLPGQLEEETIQALTPIFWKYSNMNKRHLNRRRIAFIMSDVISNMIYGNQYKERITNG